MIVCHKRPFSTCGILLKSHKISCAPARIPDPTTYKPHDSHAWATFCNIVINMAHMVGFHSVSEVLNAFSANINLALSALGF